MRISDWSSDVCSSDLHPDKGGQYAWGVLSRVLSYAADLVPEIADDILAVDTAMKTGYAWKYGPFQQIDQLGTQWFADKLKASGMPEVGRASCRERVWQDV